MRKTDSEDSIYKGVVGKLQQGIDEDTLTVDDLKKDNEYVEASLVAQYKKMADNYYTIYSDVLTTFRDDVRFLYGDQWTPDLRSSRTQKKKPVLTFNYLVSQVENILGEEIQNDPTVTVTATSPNVDQKEIDARSDLLRQVFYDNKMDIVKQYTMLYMLAGGFSVIEVGYDYEHPKTYDKKITIKYTDDPLSYFFDPYSRMPDKSDGMYCGRIIQMTDEQYDLYFPKATSRQSFNVTMYDEDYTYNSYNAKKIMVAEFFVKEPYEETICLLSNGESLTKDKAEEMITQQDSLIRKLKKYQEMGASVPSKFMEKITIVQEEDRVCYKIIHYFMNGAEVLEYGDWPSDLLPYIFVPCRLVRVEGVEKAISFHHYAHDTQRYMNYLGSEAADVVMTQHNKNWLVPINTIKGDLKQLWLSPQNTSPIAPYEPGPNGEKPEYVPPPQLSSDFNTQFQRCVGDIQNILGRFEANRGMQGNEHSGVAVDRRSALGNISSALFLQNLNLALEQVANVCLSLMPAVYDTQRVVTTRSKDGKENKIVINQIKDEDEKIYDMSQSGFKATIEAGVSFQGQKNAALAMLTQMTQGNPQMFALLSDLIAENMTLENMPQIVERIRMMMLGFPVPEIIAKETGMQPPPQQQPQPNPEMMIQQKELQLKEEQIKNEKMKTTVDSEKLKTDAITAHAKHIAEMEKIKAQMIIEREKATAEIKKAQIDNHTDLTKHMMSLHKDVANM